MEIKETLKNIGFEEHEITIFLYLIKRGTSSQQDISDKTGILRQTVYDIMKKMLTKGYISMQKIGKRKHYSSIDPKVLLNRLKEKEEELKQIIPKLGELKEGKIEITSEAFFGLEGLKNLFNLTLQSKSEILWIANKSLYDKTFQGYYWRNYAQKRIERKIPIKLLIEPIKETDWNTDKKVWRETKRNKFAENLTSSFVIFDDKIIIYSLEEGNIFGVFIQNISTKKSFEKMFYNLWDEAK